MTNIYPNKISTNFRPYTKGRLFTTVIVTVNVRRVFSVCGTTMDNLCPFILPFYEDVWGLQRLEELTGGEG